MRYFDHDTEACKDDLIMALRLEHGGEAVDAYWAILEYIYFYETELVFSENRAETKSVMHWLLLDYETLKKYILTMARLGLLFVKEDEETSTYYVHSQRAMDNIERYQQRVEIARQNGKKGGRKPKANRSKTKSVNLANPEETKSGGKGKGKGKGVGGIPEPPNATACGGAGEEVPTPPAVDTTKAIFDEVDRLYPDSTPCPPNLLDEVFGRKAVGA